jgi:hypothetical protein
MIALGLSGCAATPYGNFTTNTAPITLNDTLAADTMKRLEALYPPAATQFALGQPTSDKYGAALVKALRTKGYAIMEYNPDTADKQGSALSLRYVLDTPMKGLYRLTVVAGTTPITRAYVEQNNTVAPAGAWVQMEQ